MRRRDPSTARPAARSRPTPAPPATVDLAAAAREVTLHPYTAHLVVRTRLGDAHLPRTTRRALRRALPSRVAVREVAPDRDHLALRFTGGQFDATRVTYGPRRIIITRPSRPPRAAAGAELRVLRALRARASLLPTRAAEPQPVRDVHGRLAVVEHRGALDMRALEGPLLAGALRTRTRDLVLYVDPVTRRLRGWDATIVGVLDLGRLVHRRSSVARAGISQVLSLRIDPG